MTDQIEYVDRYGDVNAARPDPETMCQGQCEGTGVYPVQTGDPTLSHHEHAEIARLQREVGLSATGWYFVTCPTCGGTGKRVA